MNMFALKLVGLSNRGLVPGMFRWFLGLRRRFSVGEIRSRLPLKWVIQPGELIISVWLG